MGSGTGSSEIKGNSHALHPQYVFGPTIGLPLQEAPQQQIRAHDRNANCLSEISKRTGFEWNPAAEKSGFIRLYGVRNDDDDLSA